MSLFNKSKDNLDVTSTDDRLTKITIESPDGDIKTLEVHGVAMTTIRDLGETFQGSVALFGAMSPDEMAHLYAQTRTKLLEEIRETLAETLAKHYTPKELVDIIGTILSTMEGE